jgi:AcrR family transcriptional regulator
MENIKGSRRSPKREQLLRAAERLFSHFGTRRVSVEETCREARVSDQGAFFKKHLAATA